MIEAKLDKEVIDWNFPHSKRSKDIHSIHPYPAKFIPEIPRKLIELYPPESNTIIYDPFCGSGTTLLEAQNLGFESLGVDLNPIACLISKVKTTSLHPQFRNIASQVLAQSIAIEGEIEIPNIPNLDHWFQEDVQQTISKILSCIYKVDNEQVRRDLILALSSILVRISNQDSDTRYAAVDKNLTQESVFKAFKSSIDKLSKVKNSKENLPNCTILEKSCLEIESKDILKPIGLVITSPPYPNAYEYWLYHKYRMFWLGYDPLKVKSKEIGARAHYYKKNPPSTLDFKNQMKTVLENIWKNSVKNAKVCIVIGRSKIHGKIINNSKLILDAALDLGYEEHDTITRTISKSRKSFNLSHGKIKEEKILILNRP